MSENSVDALLRHPDFERLNEVELRTEDEIRKQINKSYKQVLKREGSNGVRRVNAQIADYMRDASIVGGGSAIVAYPQWCATAQDMLAAIEKSSYSDHADLGVKYSGAPQPAHHDNESFQSILRLLVGDGEGKA